MINLESETNDPYESMTDDVFGDDIIDEIPFDEEFKPDERADTRYRTNTATSHEERQWAMWTHLSGLAGYLVPFGNIIGPLVIWLSKKDEMPSIDQHGKDALNFQISISIAFVVAAFLCIILIGIPILFVLGIVQLVVPILVAIKASKGEPYKYPFKQKYIK